MLACVIGTGAASLQPGDAAREWSSSVMASYNRCSASAEVNDEVLLLAKVLEHKDCFILCVPQQLGLQRDRGR